MFPVLLTFILTYFKHYNANYNLLKKKVTLNTFHQLIL